jgi:histidyl-tRNA synthetase
LTALKKYYRSNKSDLCEECRKKMNKEPLLVLGCEEKKCRKINDKAPPIVDYLCDTCQNHFTKLLEYLDEMEIPYNLNTCLVRRMNYYNGPVFEIWPVDEKKDSEEVRSLAGGGRFNTLIAKLGQEDIHACGITIGIERTILRIKYNNIPLGIEEEDKIFLAQLGENARVRSFSLFEELRRCGFAVRQSFTSDNLKRQMEEAKKMGAKIILILGQKENNDNTILIRDGESGNQEIIDQSKIIEELTKRLQNKPQEKKEEDNK